MTSRRYRMIRVLQQLVWSAGGIYAQKVPANPLWNREAIKCYEN